MGASESADVYDWWSRHPRVMSLLYAVAFMGREDAVRRRALATLDPGPGERVLESGCGPGNSFAPVRERVGPEGAVVGVDASAGMVRTARDRVREHDWKNVHALRGDARRLPVPSGSVDAVYAAMSLSAVPDPAGAVADARRALRPGGRLVVLDAQPFQYWPFRALNPVVVPLAERLTDWVPEVDLLAALDETFASVAVTTFNAGTLFVARAETSERE